SLPTAPRLGLPRRSLSWPVPAPRRCTVRIRRRRARRGKSVRLLFSCVLLTPGRSHAVHERAQARAHLLRRQPDASAVPGEHPLEAVVGELRERAFLLAPGIPARVAKRDQVLALSAPGERIAGEEIRLLEQVDHAALGVAGDGDRQKPLADLRGLAATQQIGRVRRGAGIVLVYPDPRAEMLRVAAGIRDVV